MCRKHFHPTSSSVLFCVFLGGWVVCCWLFFLSFIKGEKKSQKDTSGRKTTDMHYGEPSNPGKNYHRETNRGSRSKKNPLQASQDPPQSQLELCFCTTDKTGSVINHLSSRHRGLREGSCGAKKGPTQAPRQAPRRD